MSASTAQFELLNTEPVELKAEAILAKIPSHYTPRTIPEEQELIAKINEKIQAGYNHFFYGSRDYQCGEHVDENIDPELVYVYSWEVNPTIETQPTRWLYAKKKDQ